MLYCLKMKIISRNTGCRMCKSKRLTKILKFGPQPPANAFLKKSDLNKKEAYYPLDVYFCRDCHLVQLCDIVSPEILFKDYLYVSSTSPVFIKHFEDFAKNIKRRFHLNRNSLIIDIGSNDGILLKPCAKLGLRVLGVEPAENIAKMARYNGIDTISEYFNLPLVNKIKQKCGQADIITANNVFAHINNIDEVCTGVYELLKPKGVFIIEAPYIVDFLTKNLFDTVYHEHLSYLALQPLIRFFTKWCMILFDVERIPTHGGSIRIYVAKTGSGYIQSERVRKLLILEEEQKLHQLSTYLQFAQRIEKNKQELKQLLSKLKKSNKTIIGFGAPAKGNTLLNYFEINGRYLDYIVDDSVYKQGLFTPGTHIPVVSPQKLTAKLPDYILILAWNFTKSILDKYKRLQKLGVKFIVPVPKPQIILLA